MTRQRFFLTKLGSMKRAVLVMALALMHTGLGGCLTTSTNKLMERADAGDAKAQYTLGMRSFKGGKDVLTDPEFAVELLRKAATQGHFKAQVTLGEVLYRGLYKAKANTDEGIQWMKKAALAGDVLSQLRLGVLYVGGLGEEMNRVEAYAWFNLAEAGKDSSLLGNTHWSTTEARVWREQLEVRMSKNELQSAKQLARTRLGKILSKKEK